MKKTGLRPEIINKLGLGSDYNITESLIHQFGNLYSGRPINSGTKAEKRFNDKLSALSLLKQKRLNGVPASKIKEGFVYILSNPAWAGMYKIGYSLDPRDRLMQYQVGCPLADYKLEGYYFSFNVRSTEKYIHSKLERFNINGEWFKLDLENLRKFILRQDDIMN